MAGGPGYMENIFLFSHVGYFLLRRLYQARDVKVAILMDSYKIIRVGLIVAAVCAELSVSAAAPMPTAQSFANSLGMKFVRIEPGEFRMGGLHDELPAGLANEVS